MTSRRGFLLQDLPDENLDQILSLSPIAKGKYFAGIAKEFYPDLKETSEYFENVVESYISSFYIEKMYRSNRFFNEKFTPIYTDTGLIRNIWSDLFFIDTDLITH